MTRRHLLRAIAITAAGVATACPMLLVTASPASAARAKIGPHEVYTALINKRTGRFAPVAIQMACFGPVRPGQTGHPLPGQTISVLPAATASGNIGRTGADANSVGAFFGAPPPAGARPRADTSNVIFRYFGTRALPQSLLLPCGGSGTVIFVSIPLEPSKSVQIPVAFEGQP